MRGATPRAGTAVEASPELCPVRVVCRFRPFTSQEREATGSVANGTRVNSNSRQVGRGDDGDNGTEVPSVDASVDDDYSSIVTVAEDLNENDGEILYVRGFNFFFEMKIFTFSAFMVFI